jgi:hypothetical protein
MKIAAFFISIIAIISLWTKEPEISPLPHYDKPVDIWNGDTVPKKKVIDTNVLDPNKTDWLRQSNWVTVDTNVRGNRIHQLYYNPNFEKEMLTIQAEGGHVIRDTTPNGAYRVFDPEKAKWVWSTPAAISINSKRNPVNGYLYADTVSGEVGWRNGKPDSAFISKHNAVVLMQLNNVIQNY